MNNTQDYRFFISKGQGQSMINPEDRWVQTYSGIRFYPFDPNPEDINLYDIAWHLSFTIRYNKAVKRYYSVGEHSVLMTEWIYNHYLNYKNRRYKNFITYDKLKLINICLWSLHHDDAEAYLVDLASPIKSECQPIVNAENRLIPMIKNHFDIETDDSMERHVSWVDHSIVADEKKQVLKDDLYWPLLKHKPLGIKIKFWKQKKAYKQFLKWHNKLIDMRGKLYMDGDL